MTELGFEDKLSNPIRRGRRYLETMTPVNIKGLQLLKGDSPTGQFTMSRIQSKIHSTLGIDQTLDIDPEDSEDPARFLLPEYKKATEIGFHHIASLLPGGIATQTEPKILSRNKVLLLRNEKNTPLYALKLIDSEERARKEFEALQRLAREKGFILPITDLVPIKEGNVTLWALAYPYAHASKADITSRIIQTSAIHSTKSLMTMPGYQNWQGQPLQQVRRDIKDDTILIVDKLGQEYEAAADRLRQDARCPIHSDAKQDNFLGDNLIDLESMKHGHPAIDYAMIALQDERIDADDTDTFSRELKRLKKRDNRIQDCTPQEIADAAIVGAFKELGGLHTRSKTFGWDSRRRKQKHQLASYLGDVAVNKGLLNKNPYDPRT